MKIIIGLPHLNTGYNARFGNSLTGLIAHSLGQGLEIGRLATFRDNITFARNKISSEFMEMEDADYLFFLDDDMVFNKELLVNLLQHEKKIVGGLTFRRGEPHEPSIYNLNNKDRLTYDPVFMWKPGELLELDALGMAATLIHRSVFEEMKSISQLHKDIWGFYDNLEFLGEDFRFCRKARDLDFKIYCDTGQVVGHIVEKVIRFEDYDAMSEYKEFNIKKARAKKRYEQEKSKN